MKYECHWRFQWLHFQWSSHRRSLFDKWREAAYRASPWHDWFVMYVVTLILPLTTIMFYLGVYHLRCNLSPRFPDDNGMNFSRWKLKQQLALYGVVKLIENFPCGFLIKNALIDNVTRRRILSLRYERDICRAAFSSFTLINNGFSVDI